MIDFDFGGLSISFTTAAMLVCISDLVFTGIQNRMWKKQNVLFVIILVVVALNSACNSITALFQPYVNLSDLAKYLSETSRYFYFVVHTALAPLVFFYVARVCGISLKIIPLRRYALLALFILSEILVIINPFTKWVYYVDENYEFQRNTGEIIIYAVAAFFLILSLVLLFNSWKGMNNKRRLGVVLFSSIAISGVLIQMLSKDIKVELFAEAIGLTGLMIIIENEDDRIDPVTGVYNRQALVTDLRSFVYNRNPIQILCVRITTPDLLFKRPGADNNEIVEEAVSAYLKTVVKKYNIYRVGSKNFVLVFFEQDNKHAIQVAEKISSRFDKPWKLSDSIVLLTVAIQVTGIPGRINTVEDALYMFESNPPANNNKRIFVDADLDYLYRRVKVENSVIHALAEGRFEVYYQPTYTINDRKLHGAEALIRMHDDEMGMIFPDEFIPIAEETGIIDAIDDFVLLEVCKLVKNEKLEDTSMDCININLSMLQCMKPDFVEHISGIVEESGVSKNFINFEITESIAADSYNILSRVVSQLRDEGFRVSMDDYGTGYSNMKALFSMDLDVVKIDKSILWEAEKSELGGIILRNSIQMIHQMNREILVEGVETEDHIKLLEPLKIHYLQGYFFSKPVPRDKFLEIVRNNG